MEIAFKTKALRTVCLNATAMDELYGTDDGMLLRAWLADVRAAECLGDLPSLATAPKSKNLGEDTLSISVGNTLTVNVKPNHLKLPRLQNGDINWLSISRILIHRIEKDNG